MEDSAEASLKSSATATSTQLSSSAESGSPSSNQLAGGPDQEIESPESDPVDPRVQVSLVRPTLVLTSLC